MLKKQSLLAFAAMTLLAAGMTARAQETEPAASSALTGVQLPNGAVRLTDQSVPADVTNTLAQMVQAAGPNVKQGRTEVLAWTGAGYKKAVAPQLMQQVSGGLASAGWNYEVTGQTQDATVFTLMRTAPTKRGLFGFWVPSNKALVLVWTEVLPVKAAVSGESAGRTENNENAGRADSTANTARPVGVPASAITLNVSKTADNVNVMGNAMPKLPMFPALAKKPGKVRGYVKDVSGKPLEGAVIGVRSTAVGGAYSGASGVTDANGYYEITVPFGVASFYAAGYTVDYGEGRAALGLHPADGHKDEFASADGEVKNFVLLSYGIGDRDEVSENPRYLNNYYGGSVCISYFASEADDNAVPRDNLPVGSEIEIILTPEGAMFDGSQGQSFVVRKTINFGNFFYINNLPIGHYRINARMANGKPMKMTLNKPKDTVFGMQPAETTGSAELWFHPMGAKAGMALPAHGNWNAVEIRIQRP